MQRRINPLPIIIFILLCLSMDRYVFGGIKTLAQDSSSLNALSWSFWLFSSLLLLLLLIAFWQVFRTRSFTGFPKIIFNAFLALFVAKLSLIIILFGEDIYRLIAFLVNYVISISSDGVHEGSLFPGRSNYVSMGGVMVSAFVFLSFVYGMVRGKYNYRVHRETLYFKDLPDNFDGFTITHISDIHAGSFDNAAAVQRGIEIIKAQKSDLFVFTGDLVNNEAGEILPWVDHFKQIRAPFGQFSILGNHDYGDYIQWKSPREKTDNLQALKQHHAALGYRLLIDEQVSIEKNGQKILLLGVENWGLGFGQRGNLPKALNGAGPDTFKILLSHDPSHWDAEVKNNAANIQLTLSGHTHGMQLGIELFGFKWSPVKYRYHNWAGLAKENDRYLYVNRGFGFIGFSGRVGIWPEITVLTLKKKAT